MWEKNLNQKLILIGAVLVCAALLIYPPKENLRPGLDIAGGVSLIFEIDDTGMEDAPNLAEDMKRLLQKRVDPDGVYNLTWRVHGQNRLEVQMPLPPEAVSQKNREYAQVLEDLFSSAIKRGELERAFSESAEQRTAAITELARGSAERQALLDQAAAAYDAYVAALEAYRRGPQDPAPTTPPADTTQPTTAATSEPATAPAPPKTLKDLEDDLADAEEDLTDAYDAFLATNLDRHRFLEILELEEGSETREKSLAEFKDKFPELKDKIDAVVDAHAEWRKNRGYLDGPADLRRLLRGQGVLEFRILAEPSPENDAKYDRYRRQLAERGPTPVAGDTEGWFRIDNAVDFFHLKTQGELKDYDLSTTRYVAAKRGNDYYVLAKLGPEDGLLAQHKNWQLRSAVLNRDTRGGFKVEFQLDVSGGQLFRRLTGRNIDKPLCILLDGVAYSAPDIKSKIGMRGEITGDFSREKASYLVQTMQAGSLPARLKETPISERTMSSSLGATNLDMAFRAGVIGVIVVAVFMAIYYVISGFIANTALLLNIVLVLAVMAMLEARFTLAGIAGVILTIGMSVDANVLIFERMREEKRRGSSLRLVIKNGYEKAFSTIIDANITTLLTCVILYYVGSEEIKGFGLTLGWGIAISMFTALFVTRTIFALLIRYGLIRDIRMLSFIGVPKINWYAKRKFFVPLSIAIVVIGLLALWKRGSQEFLDVEFLGGTSVEIEVKPPREGEPTLDDVKIAELLEQAGRSIEEDARKLAQVEVDPVVGSPNAFRVHAPGVSADRLTAMLTEPLEENNWLQRGGMESRGEEELITVRLQSDVGAEQFREFVAGLVPTIQAAGKKIGGANVGSVIEAAFTEDVGRFWNITTTEKNSRLVQHALEMAIGNRLKRQHRIRHIFKGTADGHPYPILDRRLENVIQVADFPAGVGAEPLTDFLGGMAMYFDEFDPPQSIDREVPGSLPDRLRNMRLQPGYQDYPYRDSKVIGVRRAGEDEEGRPLYSSVVVVLADDNYRYSDDPDRWYGDFAQKELDLATATLDTEQALRKVSQFKPQIARRATTQASMALLLSWAMIIGYLWVRFGRPAYGLAGVAALIHDVCIALAFVGLAGWAGGHEHPIIQSVRNALLVDDFKINMTIVAAFLTIIGYSINDTIVVFDRIRETRGRLGRVTPEIINDSINQCMSRTLLTSATTFMILLIMYVFGGPSIRGFNYCMMIGILTGTYSSIAVACPLLMASFSRRLRPATA